MVTEISEETIRKVNELTMELFTLIDDEIKTHAEKLPDYPVEFAWYQTVVLAVQYILTAANEVVIRVEE